MAPLLTSISSSVSLPKPPARSWRSSRARWCASRSWRQILRRTKDRQRVVAPPQLHQAWAKAAQPRPQAPTNADSLRELDGSYRSPCKGSSRISAQTTACWDLPLPARMSSQMRNGTAREFCAGRCSGLEYHRAMRHDAARIKRFIARFTCGAFPAPSLAIRTGDGFVVDPTGPACGSAPSWAGWTVTPRDPGPAHGLRSTDTPGCRACCDGTRDLAPERRQGAW